MCSTRNPSIRAALWLLTLCLPISATGEPLAPWAITDVYPADGDVNIPQAPLLRWSGGYMAAGHDIYFGTDANAVATATPATPDIYRGRQARNATTFAPGLLAWGTTYYWRVDEISPANIVGEYSIITGPVWRFTTAADSLVVDDFELYDYAQGTGTRLYETWIHNLGLLRESPEAREPDSPVRERQIVHGGRQAMAVDYNNLAWPWHSEVQRDLTWGTKSQDWTINSIDTLVLFVRGLATNDPAPLYVSLEDSSRTVATVVHPDPQLLPVTDWTEWRIPLSRFAGPDLTKVRKMRIGVGNPEDPTSRALGRFYIDDIRVIKMTP